MGKTAKISAKRSGAKEGKKYSVVRRKASSKALDSPIDQVLYLQRTIGNQAMQGLFKSGILQSKLRIGKPNDKYELEAYRIADQVMSMPEMTTCLECKEPGGKPVQTKPITTQITPLVIRRQVEPEEEEEEEEIQTQLRYPILQKKVELEEKEEEIQSGPRLKKIFPLIQRQEEKKEEEPIQTKSSSSNTAEATAGIESNINSLKGSGQPLSESVRSYFEPRFAYDFSGVRVHTGDKASNAANSVNARAFTVGKDIVFASSSYSPETREGKKLLAHELTHTIQQTGVLKLAFIQRKESKADQAKRLKDINDASLKTAKTETKVSTAEPHWAKTLSSKHLSDLYKVLNYLKTAIPDLKAGLKKTTAARPKLDDAIKTIRETKMEVKKSRAKGYGEFGAITHFEKAGTSVNAAKKLLEEGKSKGIDGLEDWIKKVTALSAELSKARLSFIKAKRVDLLELENLSKAIKKVKTDFAAVDYKFREQPIAAERIQFVLRYFIALNDTTFTKAPTLKEATDIRSKLGLVGPDMALVFGGKSSDYSLFIGLESQLKDQIWVRAEMKKALGTSPGLKPSESDVKKWFASLSKSSNTDVIDAYRNFANGYFIHRHEADPSVLAAKQTLSTLFALPTTISGARLVVCSGFAVLGKTLLQLTGAKFKRYYIGIRASDYQIKCTSTYDDVHALAYLTRKDPTTTSKKTLNIYISNDDIVFKKEDGLGPAAVGWTHKKNPIYEGSGPTIGSAISNALKKILKKKKTLSGISCRSGP